MWVRRRLVAALTTAPTPVGWTRVGRVALVGIPTMLLIAWFGGLVHVEPVPLGLRWLRVAATALIVPAFAEEMMFRALLVPPPDHPMSPALEVALVALFVAWHPLQALTFGPPWAAAFLDPWFLATVAALGATLVRVYRVTGSVWPCVTLHWSVVVLWKLILGGPF